MDAKDFELGSRRVDRLTATKAVASDFVGRREGDRIGLILFGERAYLQVPLTLDRETVKILLLEAFIGLAGEKTAIGDAITLAVKRIHDQGTDADEQVLILLTDGANTAGEIDPINRSACAFTRSASAPSKWSCRRSPAACGALTHPPTSMRRHSRRLPS
jgi:Ca-activated chloride channel family protein